MKTYSPPLLKRIPRIWIGLLLPVLAMLSLSACQQTGNLNDQPRYDPLEPSLLFTSGSSAQVYVAGTVPQTDLAVDDPALTGLTPEGEQVADIPVEVDQALVDRGQERYDIYCAVCHGVDGAGDGRVVAFQFPQPPNLLDDPVLSKTDGHYFEVIDNGYGVMFPYGYRVKAPDRWAIIAYLRAMQLKGGHLTGNLTPEEISQIGGQP